MEEVNEAIKEEAMKGEEGRVRRGSYLTSHTQHSEAPPREGNACGLGRVKWSLF